MNVDGTWSIDVALPRGGTRQATLVCETDGDVLTGTFDGNAITDGKAEGDRIRFDTAVTSPFAMTLTCSATIDGDTMTGEAKSPMIPLAFTGKRN